MSGFSDFPYKDIIHRCFRCGYCKFPVSWIDVNNCPSYARFRIESYSCGGRLWLIRAWLNGHLKWSKHLADIVYSCTVCKNCEVKCPFSFNKNIVNMVISAREEMVETGKIPKGVKEFLKHITLYGNPYGLGKSKRDIWRDGLKVEDYNGHEYLFYVGCTGSFDPRAQHATKAVAKLFLKAGLCFGILGKEELCDGNEVKKLGEMGLFEFLVDKNMSLFIQKNIKNIITFSPHAYNSFKNYYPEYGGNFTVYHYTHILLKLIDEGMLTLKSDLKIKVTFHDPCFLGRWNGEYHVPRELLKRIPEVVFVEMKKSKESSLCCGGGGGNFYMDMLGGSENSPARRRVREAVDIGVDVVAVCCPKCLVMLDDAIKSEGLEDKIKVMDIAEIIGMCI